MMPKDEDKVYIFDTTLRDGEQGAGGSMSQADRLRIALKLDATGIDVIEAGFPASSASALQSVMEIAEQTKRAKICALARGTFEDIDAACKSLAPAGNRARIHIFIATDTEHMVLKLNKSETEVLTLIEKCVTYAKQHIFDVEFSPEVATTTERSFLYQSISTAIEAGATVINIPDTTGYSLPCEYGELISDIIRCVPRINEVLLSVHCHDDRGLATANTLEGVKAGARQVECTVNGIGERAGNASLEEVLMAFTLRQDIFGVVHTVDTTELCALSELVSEATGIAVAQNKAFVGNNAFAHESGIHQAGVLKKPGLYEICEPSMVGSIRRLPVGKLSGRAGVKAALVRVGFLSLNAEQIDRAYHEVMHYGENHGLVTDTVLKRIGGSL